MSCNLNDKKIGLEQSTGGDYILYNSKTKEKFYDDFVNNKVYRNGKRITAGATNTEVEECYEHLTTKGSMDNSVRLPDLRRLESIYILKEILTSENCSACEEYYVWEKKEKYLKEKIFCPHTGYLIILSKRNYVYKFVSAYIIERQSKKQKLINEFLEFKK